MAARKAVLTQLIQDAVLKLCTQNVEFDESLEIDGIICITHSQIAPEIVVKMHRTIMKPEEPPVQSDPSLQWTEQQQQQQYTEPMSQAAKGSIAGRSGGAYATAESFDPSGGTQFIGGMNQVQGYVTDSQETYQSDSTSKDSNYGTPKSQRKRKKQPEVQAQAESITKQIKVEDTDDAIYIEDTGSEPPGGSMDQQQATKVKKSRWSKADNDQEKDVLGSQHDQNTKDAKGKTQEDNVLNLQKAKEKALSELSNQEKAEQHLKSEQEKAVVMLQNQQKNQVPIASTLTQAPNSLTQAQNPLAQATNTLTQPPKPSTQAPTMLTQVSTTFSTQVSSILTQAPSTLTLAQADQAQNTMTQVPRTLIPVTNILAQAPNTLTQATTILAQVPTPNISMQAPSTLAQHTNTLIQTPSTLTQQAQQAIPSSQTTPVANQTVNQENTLNAGTSNQSSNLQVAPLGQPNLQAQPVLYQSSQPAASYSNSQANIGVNVPSVQSIGSQIVQVTSMANYASIQSNVALGGASHEPPGVQSRTVLNTQIVQATPRVEPSNVGLPPPGVQSNPVLGQATPAIQSNLALPLPGVQSDPVLGQATPVNQSNLALPPPGVQSNPVLGVQTGHINPQFQSALPPPGVQTNPQLSGQVRPATPDLQSNLGLPPPGLQTNPVLGGQITPNVQSNVVFLPPGMQTNPVLGAQMAQTALPTPAVSYPQTNFSVPPPQIQDPLLSYEIDREKAIQLSRRTKGIDIDRSQLNIETTQFGYHSNIDSISASSSSTLTTNPFINRIAKVEPMPPAEKHQSNPFLELDCTMEFMNRVRRLEFIKDVWNFGPKIFCSFKTIPGCWEINTSTDVVELYYQLLKSGGQ